MNTDKIVETVGLVTNIAWAAFFVSCFVTALLGKSEMSATGLVVGCAIWVSTRAISNGIAASQLLMAKFKKD